MIKTSDIYSSKFFESTNNEGILNAKFPIITINKNKQIIKYISNKKNPSIEIYDVVKKGVNSYLEVAKRLNNYTKEFPEFTIEYELEPGEVNDINYSMTSNLNLDAVMKEVTIITSRNAVISPNPLKFSILGFVLGIFIVFIYLYVYKPIKDLL